MTHTVRLHKSYLFWKHNTALLLNNNVVTKGPEFWSSLCQVNEFISKGDGDWIRYIKSNPDRSVDADPVVPRIFHSFCLGSGSPLMKTELPDTILCTVNTMRAASHLKPRWNLLISVWMGCTVITSAGWGLQFMMCVCKLRFWHFKLTLNL